MMQLMRSGYILDMFLQETIGFSLDEMVGVREGERHQKLF